MQTANRPYAPSRQPNRCATDSDRRIWPPPLSRTAIPPSPPTRPSRPAPHRPRSDHPGFAGTRSPNADWAARVAAGIPIATRRQDSSAVPTRRRRSRMVCQAPGFRAAPPRLDSPARRWSPPGPIRRGGPTRHFGRRRQCRCRVPQARPARPVKPRLWVRRPGGACGSIPQAGRSCRNRRRPSGPSAGGASASSGFQARHGGHTRPPGRGR